MAYTPVLNTFRVISAVHSISFQDPIGGSFDEQIGWVESRPGTNISPATCIDSYNLEAEVRTSRAFNPIARNTSHSLVFQLLQLDNSGVSTVTITGMLAGEAKGDMNSKPQGFSQKFKYNNAGVEDYAPISVT